jgi:hypothetical protein
MVDDECGAVGEMSDGETEGTRKEPALCRVVHHKSHIT